MLLFKTNTLTDKLSLKEFLRKNGVSLTLWRKIKRYGTILVNGKIASDFGTFVMPGDTVQVVLPNQCSIPPADIPISIKFEDEYLLVVNKPAGLLTHPTTDPNEISLANAVINYYQKTEQTCGFHPVHRLDRNTSGLVVIAKSPHIQHLLSKENVKSLQRIYWAVVHGRVTPPSGIINAPIGRSPVSIIEREVREDGQEAITKYQTIEQLNNASIVELELLTGRTHQIRVHMSFIGHPLIGDDLYGGSVERIARQALHAQKVSFTHPVSRNKQVITSSLPEDLTKLIANLKLM